MSILTRIKGWFNMLLNNKAKEKFGNITFDGSILSIGNNYSIPKEKYENHR